MEQQLDVSGVVLETERLILRAWLESDLEDLFAYASVPGVGEMAGWPHHRSPEESQAVLQRFMEQKDVFAIVHKETGKVIGSVGVHNSWAKNEPQYSDLAIKDLGYVLAKEYWGQGLVPEAARAVVDYCFDVLGMDALTCGHFVDNNQSRRVIEKLGFRYVKTVLLHAEALQQMFETKCYILFNPRSTGSTEQCPKQSADGSGKS
ncbi:MAG TPA: GNAT family N-acetyltransferase [Firmicutes bacterium]|jgi:ribosomal-protein-alanine N-acetyltransferase|nr:GNAT family N-acetyltransferase [Bacillota bacterium]